MEVKSWNLPKALEGEAACLVMEQKGAWPASDGSLTPAADPSSPGPVLPQAQILSEGGMRCGDCCLCHYCKSIRNHKAFEPPPPKAGPLTVAWRSLEKLNRSGFADLGEEVPPESVFASSGDLGEPGVAEDNLQLKRGD